MGNVQENIHCKMYNLLTKIFTSLNFCITPHALINLGLILTNSFFKKYIYSKVYSLENYLWESKF